ncbi:hypothetical protein [Mycobacteroides chelonae]|uniref:hypothetical protein n=1 Tax=Mycobacteroides chelonae TaxID=1774 RepID=UPI0009931F57|nr:hypothetical protein [Mycobacteroides chelonae]
MEIAGFGIQMVGGLITAWGLFIAWDHASSRSDQWRNGFRDKLVELAARLSKIRSDDKNIEPKQAEPKITGGTPLVIIRPVDPELRLTRIEKVLEILNDRISAAIKEADEADRLIKVRDIRWAIVGLGISLFGSFVEHLPKLLSTFCQCF